MKSLPSVAVSGIGCLCGAGNNLDDCMQNLYAGRRSPGPPRAFTAVSPEGHPVFEIADLAATGDATGFRTNRMAINAAAQALSDAGLSPQDLKNRRVGVCIGTNVASGMSNEAFCVDNTEGCDPRVSPKERFLASNPTIALMTHYEIFGPSQTVVNACSAGTDAIGLAASWIRSDQCDIVIAGGADEMYQVTYFGFISLMISDTQPCRPFDQDRRGLNLGEGGAVFILESERSLKHRSCRPRARIMGYGASADAHHMTSPDPKGTGLALAIEEAMAASGLAPTDIAFVNAHGTGTIDNDVIESRVLQTAFPGAPYFSSKGYTGHTLGAAGAVEAAISVACLEQGRIPASIGCTHPDPELPVPPALKNTPISGRYALSQTLAFGGNNAVLVIASEEKA